MMKLLDASGTPILMDLGSVTALTIAGERGHLMMFVP